MDESYGFVASAFEPVPSSAGKVTDAIPVSGSLAFAWSSNEPDCVALSQSLVFAASYDWNALPVTGVGAVTVIAFSSDRQYWSAQSRRIKTARTDQNGAYKIHGLPPGDYLIVAVDDVEQGEWFDPAYLEQAQPGAKALSLTEGQKTTQDLKGPGA